MQKAPPQMLKYALNTPLNTLHKNSPQLITNITSAKCPIPDVRQSSEQTGEYNLDSDKIKRSKAEYLRCQTSEMESPIKKSTTKTR